MSDLPSTPTTFGWNTPGLINPGSTVHPIGKRETTFWVAIAGF